MREQRLLDRFAERVRRRRHELDLGLGDLAEAAGLSRRFLTEIEAGRANPSLLKLARLAAALSLSLGGLCDLDGGARVLRIALIGLRGAGKSTLGRRLALALEVPFVELDRLIEEESGLDLAAVFALHGEDFYRRLQRQVIEQALSTMGSCVLAPGGSIVEDPDAFARLLATCRVVWLRARAEDHWNRVVRQGDTRPMAARPAAMDDLKRLLERRGAEYARAHLVLDTSARDIDSLTAELTSWAGESLRP